MPIITVQFIKDVVATPEQKQELIIRLTDTFVSVLGDVVKPFTYCLIQETPVGEWGIAGVPMPDLAYLIGQEHAGVIARSNAIMADAIGQASQPSTKSQEVTGEQAQIDRNKTIIRRFHDAIGSGDTQIFFEMFSPDFVNHLASMGGDQVGPRMLVNHMTTLFHAFPDLHFSEKYMLAQRNRVATRVVITGTHLGDFNSIPPSGKRVAFTGLLIYRLDDDGSVVERWQDLDVGAVMQQLA